MSFSGRAVCPRRRFDPSTNDEMQLAFVGLAEIEPEAGASNQRD